MASCSICCRDQNLHRLAASFAYVELKKERSCANYSGVFRLSLKPLRDFSFLASEAFAAPAFFTCDSSRKES